MGLQGPGENQGTGGERKPGLHTVIGALAITCDSQFFKTNFNAYQLEMHFLKTIYDSARGG